LFLDEPTIGVDVLGRRNILEFIKNLNREKGVTVMITSHDMDELEQLAARIVLIDRGRIAFDEFQPTAEPLWRHAATTAADSSDDTAGIVTCRSNGQRSRLPQLRL
jgi:ABC-type uncharacterized transport system ATPase subunit